MQVAAHGPQEVEGLDKRPDLAPLEHLQLQHLFDGLAGMQVLGDPEQRVEVAKAALALLDIGLDHVAAGAGAGVAFVALLQLGSDELGPGAAHDLALKAPHQLVGQLFVADQASAFQDRRPDGEVFAA